MNNKKNCRDDVVQASHHFAPLLDLLMGAVYTCSHTEDFPPNFISPSIKSITGFSAEEIISRPSLWINRIHPDSIKDVENEVDKLLKSGERRMVYRWKTADGNYIWICDVAKVIRNNEGKIDYVIGALHDITHQKKTESILSKKRDTLKRQTKELETTIHRRTERLLLLVEAQKEFIADVSHELRTPLSIIKGVAESLIKDKPDSNISKQLQLADKKVDQIADILDNLLMISRLEMGERQRERVKINPVLLVKEIWQDVNNKAGESAKKEAKLEISCDQSLHFSSNKFSLRVIITNLFKNAIEHADKKPVVKVSFKKSKTGVVTITITDNNKKIPEKDRNKIFKRFYQRRGTPGENTGFGLGLYICSRLTKYLGGSIQHEYVVKNKKILGNRFVVKIPTET